MATVPALSKTPPNPLKSFFLHLLSTKHDSFVPLFHNALSGHFTAMEEELAGKSGKASFNTSIGDATFTFLFRLLTGKDPTETKIGTNGPTLLQTWLATLGGPKIFSYLEDFLIRTIPFPAWTVKSIYKKLYEGLSAAGTATLDEAEKMWIKRDEWDEACHNLLFMLGFNTQGRLANQLPILIKWVGS